MATFMERGARRGWMIGTLGGLLSSVTPPLVMPSAAAAALNRSLTFSIDYLFQVEDPDGGGEGDGDYFPRVQIGDGPVETGPRIEDDEFEPLGLPEAPNGWVFTNANLPATKDTVDITVSMWDWDSGLNTEDDRMDINPKNDDLELNLVYNFTTGALTGDDDSFVYGRPCTHSNGLPKGQSCVEGDGDHGYPLDNDGRITRLGISVLNDVDADGIPDTVELHGVRDHTGAMVADLPAMGADPCRKNLILQTDFMEDLTPATRHSHEIKPGAVKLVRDVLDASPFKATNPCPYPGGTRRDGIGFIHRPGVRIPHQRFMGLENNADFRNARAANLPGELAPYAHYTIFAHDLVRTENGSTFNDPGTSGECCEPTRDNNKDFIVTLGTWRIVCVADFGLDYRGDATLQTTDSGDDIPNSPPPLLVDHFREWQKGAVRLGFSSGKLPPLVETGLLENDGISDGTDFTFWWTDNRRAPTGPRLLRAGRGNGPLNWNDSTTPGTNAPLFETGQIGQDINNSGTRSPPNDHDDWAAIRFRGPGSPDDKGWACSDYPAGSPACAGVGGSADGELDFDAVIHQDLGFFNRFDPDVEVAKSVDKTDAEPGDTLTYQVKLNNVGSGTAASIEAVDSPPTGPDQKRQVPYLGEEGTTTQTFTYEIPCETADAAVLTNKATATATDAGGGAEANTGNNTAQAATRVHAPRLTLAKTAPATVNAGEEMTIDLKVANVGSGTATGVTLTDTLAGGAELAVQFTARPSLLHTAGARLTDTASVVYGNAKGCTFPPVTAAASTTVTEVTPTRDPRSHGYWKTQRTTNSRISLLVLGRPERLGYVHRRRIRRRCQASSGPGVTSR
ncbi:hypothetical protein AB0J71_32665 [Nonomuraea sp. NPDC049637]|uniref:hypothetical protein n=1 Tax=Nonomuraea sp. NPDC049637 TaxID=3154356 RepID=UPI0034264B4C